MSGRDDQDAYYRALRIFQWPLGLRIIDRARIFATCPWLNAACSTLQLCLKGASTDDGKE